MAFFGLTALGPQDSFELSLVDFSYLQVFTDDDVKKAFKAADKNQRGHLDIHEQVEGFFNELYQGTPKACDLARFLEKAGKSLENNRLSLDDIRSLMDQLKEEVEKERNENKWKRGSGSDFSSNHIFREKMRNHEKMRGPRERYANTITAMQEHGWRDQLDFNRQMRHGKNSCPETIYASELVKSGLHF
ncbi:unnamed protein product [Ascophyllum nodosum]